MFKMNYFLRIGLTSNYSTCFICFLFFALVYLALLCFAFLSFFFFFLRLSSSFLVVVLLLLITEEIYQKNARFDRTAFIVRLA